MKRKRGLEADLLCPNTYQKTTIFAMFCQQIDAFFLKYFEALKVIQAKL